MPEEISKKIISNYKVDILFFLQNILGTQVLCKEDIAKIIMHTRGQHQIGLVPLLEYCLYLELIVQADDMFGVSPDVLSHGCTPSMMNDFIVEKTLSKLFSEEIFRPSMFSYNIIINRFIFKNEMLPLAFATFRNTLAEQGFFEIERDNNLTIFYINTQYEQMLSTFNKQNKKLIGLSQLKEILERRNQAGDKAEKIALAFEKKRIKNILLNTRIRAISDIDVCAGYDIVSFDSDESVEFDRFIEVKAISGRESFYWSINELRIAKLKEQQYFLYLVDIKEAQNDGYCPIIICNPADIVFKSDNWVVDPQTFLVSRI